MMNSKSIFFALFILFVISLFSCKKDNYSTVAEGSVISRDDTTGIATALVKIAHWDGRQNSDTDIVLTRTADTLGNFHVVFELEDDNDFYWAFAVMGGFENSSWETIDAGYTNTVIIEMDTVQ